MQMLILIGHSWTMLNFRWATGISLTPEEEKDADIMSYIAYAQLALVNDLFSWDKEYTAHVDSNGEVPLVNAVHIVAVTQSLSHCAAKAVVMAEIRAHEERFCHLKEEYMETSDPSSSVLRWLELLEHAMAGNWVWSLCVPRYNKVDRNPYKDHLERFGSNTIRILTPPVQDFNLNANSQDCKEKDLTNLKTSSKWISNRIIRLG